MIPHIWTGSEKAYHETWSEPPLPWVKRVTKPVKSSFRSSTGSRSWHLAIGIRKDNDTIQTYCNVGEGPGPFDWREKPDLVQVDREWFCRRCVAEWTKEVDEVTVKVEGMRVTKGQLERLIEAISGTDLLQIELRQTNVEDSPALLAIVTRSERNEDYTERWLVAGDGVVKL